MRNEREHERELERELELERQGRLANVPQPLRVVCLGGGTGVPTVLRGLRPYTSPRPGEPWVQLTAIVTMTDDGGSSGRLRKEFATLPPGDVRNCLVALSGGTRRPVAQLFQYRFENGRGLKGHTVGNLMLTALSELRGDFLGAVRFAGLLLGARGRVLPSTLRPVQLVAELADGRRIVGEKEIVRARGRVKRLELTPSQPPPAPGVLSALENADVVVIGPGSLYSSLLPNLLIGGVAEALQNSRALKVLVLNLMTQPGETEGYSAAEHVEALLAHAGPVVDCVLVNDSSLPSDLLARYAQRGSEPVGVDVMALRKLGVSVVRAPLSAGGNLIRHQSRKLGHSVVRLAKATHRTQR
jgi:uncharacterized cofD-like protein